MIQLRDAPLLSILLPTKDRYGTLVPVVNEILGSIDDERLEIVICDNSGEPDTQEVERLVDSDARISYHHGADDLSIVDNTERGIGFCRGEYLCFIGDDDLVSPYIMQIVEWLKSQDADCLIYPPARYWWTSVHFAKESRSQKPGIFWLPKDRGGSTKRHNSAAELDAVLSHGGVAYRNLPRLYHGIVSRRSIQRVFDKFGKYVPGSSPDMALCLALALTNEHYLSIDYPVTMFGASRNSGGGWTAARKHYGRIEDQRFLPRDILDNWDARLPKIWSEQVIYPQTIYEIMSRAGRRNGISYTSLYASLIAYEPHIFRYLWPILKKHVAKHPADIVPILAKTAVKIAGKTRTAFRRETGLGMPFDLYSLPDVSAVMAFLSKLPPPAIARTVDAMPH